MEIQMKLNQIAFAIATLAIGTSAHAAIGNATAQALVNDAVANSRVIYLSGASATQSGLQGISTALFQAGSSFRFANTTASSRDFEAVGGKLAAAAGTWAAGTNVVIVDRVKGGSVFGVDPVARATAIENLVVTDATCTGALGTSAAPFVCTTGAAIVSDAGISDVAPALFQSPINTEGETAAPALTPAEMAEFDAPGYSGPIYALGFGYAFSNNLPDFHLTHAAVNGLLSGNVFTWNGVDSSLPTEDVVVCRRVPGSGTQAVYNMYNNNYPCDLNAFNPPVDRDTSGLFDDASNTYNVPANGGDGSGYAVIENSTSGDVRNCLTNAAAGTSYATKDRDGVAVTVNFAGPRKAIGLLSLDSMSSSKTAAAGWSFRSVNGAGKIHCDTACTTAVAPVTTGTGTHPTAANVENGTWDLQGHISMNIPKRTTGNKREVLNQFLAAAQNPAVLDSVAALNHVAAAVAVSGYTGTGVQEAKYLNNNQCAPYSRFQ